MSNHLGSEGLVKVGSNTIAEVTAWTLSESSEMVEDTELSDTSKSFKADLKGWTVSIEAHWDETDAAGQEAMTNGTTVALNLYPEGAAGSDQYFTGSVIISGIERSGGISGVITASFTGQGTGALSKTTV